MATSTPSRPTNQGIIFTVANEAGFTPFTPLRVRNKNIPEHALLDESNDDVERTKRRKSKALQRTLNALPSGSTPETGLNDSIRKLSDEDLKSQLQIFYKLNAANKISAKNAWNLKVIDILKQIVTKNDPDVLKVAGSSLEIAGKVYGLRVDDLHAEGLKLAGSLARNFASKENEAEDENNNPETDEQQNVKQKRQPKRKRALLSTDKKHTVNPDPKAFLESLPKLESVAFSVRTDPTLSATGNLFTSKIRMDPAGYKFMFMTKEKAWTWKPGDDPSVKAATNRKFPLTGKSVKNFKICAPFKDFRVDMWDPETEMVRNSNVLEDVVFDENGIPIAELDGSICDVFEERDNEDLNDDNPIEEEIRAPLIRQDLEYVVDFAPNSEGLTTSIEKSVYSFNNIIDSCSGKIDQIWAGPSHWKLKFLRRKPMIYSGRDRNAMKADDKNKKRNPKRKISPVRIDLSVYAPCRDFSNVLKKPCKKKTCVLDANKIYVPILQSCNIKLLENIEYLMTIPTMKPVKKRQKSDVEYNLRDYDYNNPNDSNYCPQLQVNEADNGSDSQDEGFNDDGLNSPVDEAGEVGGFIGDNLVDAPDMLQQNYMHYATRPKKMDMKKLKQAVWCTLTNNDVYAPSTKVIPTMFSKMYKELQKRISEKMILDLSCPLVFVALLHLCNEENLALVKGDNISDFGIKGPVI